MLNLENISLLKKHLNYLKNKIGTQDIFLVGGCIRDLLLDIEKNPYDVDLTLGGQPQDIYKTINKKDISIFKTDKFGTITILPKEKEIKKIFENNNIPTEQLKYEITPLRKESGYDDFRHPTQIEWTPNILLDSNRRDFTINCIYYTNTDISDIKNDNIQQLKDFDKLIKQLDKQGYLILIDLGLIILQDKKIIGKIFDNAKLDNRKLNKYLEDEFIINEFLGKKNKIKNWDIIIDPHQGIQDIYHKNLKAVGNPDKRFNEDALRIIRAIRFINILNQKLEIKIQGNSKNAQYFDIESMTWLSMKANAQLIKNIAKERIKDEITKVFKANNPFGFVALLDELDILKIIFPGVYKTKNINQPVRYHPFDVYAHTLLTLYYLQQINSDYLVKLGMLYHDVGKPIQYEYIEKELKKDEIKRISGTDMHHPNVGEPITLEDLKALGFSKKEINDILFYVKNHMLVGDIVLSKPVNLAKKIKKRISEFGLEKLNNLIDITIGDRLGHFNPIQPPEISDIYEFKDMVKNIYDKLGEFSMQDLKISGYDIMQEFKIQAGPQVGKYMKKAFEWVLQNPKNRNNKDKIINFLKKK